MTTLQAIRQENMIECGFDPDVTKRIKVCRICGRSCGVADDYCEGCGAVPVKETLFDFYRSQHLACPDCDTVVAKSTQFCPMCGRQLRREVILPFAPTNQQGGNQHEASTK